MVAAGLPYSWRRPCATRPCPASTGGKGPSLTAGSVGRAPDMASVVCHMSYCHEMSVCQICFLLLACGKLSNSTLLTILFVQPATSSKTTLKNFPTEVPEKGIFSVADAFIIQAATVREALGC